MICLNFRLVATSSEPYVMGIQFYTTAASFIASDRKATELVLSQSSHCEKN